MKTLKELVKTNARQGKVEWIGIRPERLKTMKALKSVEVTLEGLSGDHYTSGGKRSITLVQHEHLTAIESFMGISNVEPECLRRNIVISRINLVGLKHENFSIGEVVLQGTGICAPCSRMEKTLGTGGYAAVRGHGGITAKIIKPGIIQIGDLISLA